MIFPRSLAPLACAVLVAVAPTATPTFAADSTQRPNVLLICVDDLKPTLGCYGETLVQSPHIDRLAARGAVFERAYCNQAVCSPSRNALMTGLRSTTLGIYDLPTNFRAAAPDAVTLTQYFRQHGYRTEALGKILHTGHGNHDDAASWSVPSWRPSGGAYALPANKLTRGPEGERTGTGPVSNPTVEAADVGDEAYPDGLIAAEAVRRLRAAKERSTEPFFLAVGFLKPHLPFSAPKKYWDLYERAAFKLATVTAAPVGAPAYAATTWGEMRNYSDVPKTGPLGESQQRELIHGYHAAISYMDAQLGKVTAELERLGLAQNTIVALWGDHGWHLGDHGQWCKHSNYEQATRIPLVVVAPGVARAGAHSRALVESVDLFPTLAELARLPAPAAPAVPQKLDGQSFVGALRDPAAPTKEAVFHSYPRTRPGDGAIIGRALRTDRHRLVEWKKPGAPAATAEIEVYDYNADPLETKNLAADQPEVVAQLRRILDRQPEAKPQLRLETTSPAPSPKKKKKAE